MTFDHDRADFWSFGIGFPPGGIMILIGPFACGIFWEDE